MLTTPLFWLVVTDGASNEAATVSEGQDVEKQQAPSLHKQYL